MTMKGEKRQREGPNRVNFPPRKQAKTSDDHEGSEAEKDPKEHHYLIEHGEDIEKFNLFLKNFDVSIKEDDIRREFEERGVTDIVSVRIPKHFDNTPKPFAYVTFSSEEDAAAALAKTKDAITVHKRTWFIAKSRPTKALFEPDVLFASKLPTDMVLDDLKEQLNEVTQTEMWTKEFHVKDIRLPFDKETQMSKGYGYIEFDPLEGDLAEMHVATLFSEPKTITLTSGHDIRLGRSVPLKDHRWQVGNKNLEREQRPRNEKTVELAEDTVFVKNLPFKVDEQDLEMLFEEHVGAVAQVKLVRDDKKRSKGFGFVQLENKEDMLKALTLDGLEELGRPMEVKRSDRHITQKTVRPSFDIKEQKNRVEKGKKEQKRQEETETDNRDGEADDSGFGGIAALLGSLREEKVKKAEDKTAKSDEQIPVHALKKQEGGRLRLDDDLIQDSTARTVTHVDSNADFRKMFLGE